MAGMREVSDKEWIYRTLKHEEMELTPYHFDFTPPARKKLADHYSTDKVEDVLGLPVRWGSPSTIKPLYADRGKFGDEVKDEWGVTWSVSDMDRGTPIRPALPEPSFSHYTFPNPGEEYRFENLADWCETNRDHFKVIWIGDLWERATFMRGMENVMMDLVLNEEFASRLLERICDYVLKTMEIIISRFDFEAISLSDDYGSQKSLQMSPKHWRKFIKPFLKEIFKLTKQSEKIMMLHSCGNVYEVIGEMIDIGLDILHPIQPETMDIYRLKGEFGRDLTFQGGLGTQDLLLRSTPEEIRNEVRTIKRMMGKGGGYILDTGITIQDDIPLVNFLAMIEEAKAPA